MTAKADFTDKEVVVGGIKLHYLDWGNPSKPPMLLLHGGAQTAHSWDEFSRSMRGDYHVIALEQRGHGDSTWAPDGDYSRKAHLKDISGFVDTLKLDKFVLVGLSMGGMNAIVYSGTYPKKVDRLVIVDIGPETMKQGREHIRQFQSETEQLDSMEEFVQRAHKFNPRRPIEQLRERLQWNLKQLPNGKWTWKYDNSFRNHEETPAGLEARSAELWGYVKEIKAPTLLVKGAQSDVLSMEGAL